MQSLTRTTVSAARAAIRVSFTPRVLLPSGSCLLHTSPLQRSSNQQGPNSSPHSASFGFQTVAESVKQQLVNGVFSNVAGKYDVMNDLMSAGVHRLWKDEFVKLIDPPVVYSGENPFHVVDLAGGTGDITFRLHDKIKQKVPPSQAYGAVWPRLTVCDINEAMLKVGQKRAEEAGYKGIEWVCANGEALPFPDNSVDVLDIAFGIRNFTHIEKGLAEAYRVLKPGGRFLCLEFSKVDTPVLSQFYDLYSFNVIPLVGQLVANDRDSYQYLVESIRKFPPQEQFAQMIWNAGFREVKYTNMTFGVVAIHTGFKV
eukprot:GDKI01014523.1.p1 GENE.GDKI01014523.1~~GDKI01014523.1.p1  ORF type:complete len:321 (+),score=89.77 GDKI01014523.1:26-964(+)